MGIIEDIKSLKIQGARDIAIESLKYLKNYGKKNGFKKRFEKKMNKLEKVRPTAVLLHNALRKLRKDKSKEKIDNLIEELNKINDKIAKQGKKLIKSEMTVHTHCHSSSALAAIKKAAENKKFKVVVDETRPKEQGIKTAKELSKFDNIDVILITDDAAGVALSPFIEPTDDLVLVGCDAIREEGIVNKIGTYLLAVAASEQNIPFYVAGSTWKYDTRKNIEIEERDPSEVYSKIKNVTIKNPAFDKTKWKYINGLITEEGIKKPREVMKELKGVKDED